jgi:membrane protease YdiL (CAAX protease family)
MSRKAASSSGSQVGLLTYTQSRSRALVELCVGYALILLVIWTPRPWQKLLYLAALAWILLATFFSFDGWTATGLRPSRSVRTLWIVPAALLLAAVVIVFAVRLQTLHLPRGTALFIKSFWGYALWSLVQQFLLQCFVLLRLLRILPNQRSAVITAVCLFGVAHLPNPILTVVTLIWGGAACLLFLRYRNLYTLGVVHAIFGITMAITVPGPISRNMRVGLGYLRYPSHRHHLHLSQTDHTVSTVACVTAEAPIRRSAPRSSIENSRQRGQQHVTPVEVCCAFVEVRQAKQDCRRRQRRITPHAPLQQILHPASKEEFFRHRNKEKGQNKAAKNLNHSWPRRMQMQKPKHESKRQSNWNIADELTQPYTNITQA